MAVSTMPRYRVIPGEKGNRYRFYCDLSGAAVETVEPICGESPEQELELAWEQIRESSMNRCHRCGRWVIDAMFNADVLECVDCAPWEGPPQYCKSCGVKLRSSERFCPVCKKPLLYEGRAET